jgi:CDP-2,3-bis-(O-geranylgeranyl)-sn-glycerol synthase
MLHQVLQVLYFFVPAYLANMVPVLVKGHFEVLAGPIDVGWRFRGNRLLGDHKTWRGLLAGIVVGGLVFAVQQRVHRAGFLLGITVTDYDQLPLATGLLLGLGTGIGDALKSFFKRQIGIAPGASWVGFDQVDFLVGAYAFVSLVCVPPLVPTLLAAPVVFAGSLLTTASGYRLGLKDSWI